MVSKCGTPGPRARGGHLAHGAALPLTRSLSLSQLGPQPFRFIDTRHG